MSYRQFKRRFALAMQRPYFEIAAWPAREVLDWWHADAAAPIGELREDYRAALVAREVARVFGGSVGPITDFLLFSQEPTGAPEPRQNSAADIAYQWLKYLEMIPNGARP